LNGTAVAKDGKPYNNTCSWYMTLKNDRIVKAIGFFETLELADIWKRIPI
jgi:ketosteroid isomerase-like protein